MGYGIDIGSTALKVVAVRRALGRLKLVGAARRRLPRPAPADPKAAVLRLMQEALGASNGRRAGVVGLSGRDINLQVIQQPAMKALNYRVMMRYELDQRRGQATDLYVDYCTLREPDAYFPQYLALIGIGKSAYVDERLDLLARAAVDVQDAVPNAFALYAAHRNAYGVENGTVLLLDVGSDNMDLAFVRGGKLIFARNVSSGARVFDSNIAGMLSVGPDEAEFLKVKHANLAGGAVEDDESQAGRIRPPVRTAAGQLSGFITASINHARLQLNDRELAVDKMYLSGGGARVAGLPEYLSGAIRIPVESLDPFRGLDTSVLDASAEEEFRRLPTDMAVAAGLSLLASPSADRVTLSILPEPFKKRRARVRSLVWLGGAAATILLTLAVLTVTALARRGSERAALDDFTARTSQVSARIEEMNALEGAQLDVTAKLDYLLSHLSGARLAVDAVAKLRRVLPGGVLIHEIRLVVSGGRGEERGHGGDERLRAGFHARGKGLVVGDLEEEQGEQVRIRGHAEPYAKAEMSGDPAMFLAWPSASRALLILGEVDENIRGGPKGVLNAMRDQLSDPSRGIRGEVKQGRSDKPGWRTFELRVMVD
jgi:type IV pilus assembly protein PilM